MKYIDQTKMNIKTRVREHCSHLMAGFYNENTGRCYYFPSTSASSKYLELLSIIGDMIGKLFGAGRKQNIYIYRFQIGHWSSEARSMIKGSFDGLSCFPISERAQRSILVPSLNHFRSKGKFCHNVTGYLHS